MADYLLKDTVLMELASPIKTILNSTNKISIAEMTSAVEKVNQTINSQSTMISNLEDQLKRKLLVGLEATVDKDSMAQGASAYAKNQKIEGTIPVKTASNISVNGNTITIPSGIYKIAASKSVATATQATPTINVSTSGLITASTSQAAGYVAAGTKTATSQLTTQGAKTITPSKSSQTAVAANTYVTGAVTVGAIPSSYVKPTATKTATTHTPGSSSQTAVAAGTYCSGAQTLSGDSNLVAGNIKKGVSIFGVTGTYEGSAGFASGALVKGKAQSYVIANGYSYGYGQNSSPQVSYGTDIYVSNNSVTIESPTTVDYSSSMDTSVLKGKYVYVSDSTWFGGTRRVIWIPTDATFSTGSSGSGTMGQMGNSLTVSSANVIYYLDSKVS